ncbi:MAG: hypothetical protein ABH871_04795 [Pseudomonadota bacterium]
MRRTNIILLSVLFIGLFLVFYSQPSAGQDIAGTPVASMQDYELDSSPIAAKLKEVRKISIQGDGDFIALSKIIRTVWYEPDVPKTDTYAIEYAANEFRTTVRISDHSKGERVADAFFNNDRTLSFVRKRAARDRAETIHFVYDANGNLVEKRVSYDDKPVDKFEYEYDQSNLSRREIKKSQWIDESWKPSDTSMELYVNVSGLPTAFESIENMGRRTVTFEYALNDAALDSYTDTFTGEDGESSDTFAYVTYNEQKPSQFTVRSSDKPGEELRIIGQWQGDKFPDGRDRLVSESMMLCINKRCKKVEERTFEYQRIREEALMPPPSVMLPFLELGSSLFFIEKPELLLGKEGIGLPTWLIRDEK